LVSISKTAMCGLLFCGALCWARAGGAAPEAPDAMRLEAMRQSGNDAAERAHAWSLIAGLTRTVTQGSEPLFETWHGEDQLFGSAPASGPGIQGFSRSFAPAATGADVPVITYTLYNDAAFQHIIRYRLNSAGALTALRQTGAPDPMVSADRKVPDFPADAMVLKTSWWPVAKTGLTALPVWDPEQNPPDARGNPYIGWRRVVAVDPSGAKSQGAVTMAFAGTTFAAARRVALSGFYNVSVDASLAARMMRDAESRKAAMIALGRPLEAGDHLALVGANLASREITDWIWVAFWWHDQPQGAFAPNPFAADRPASLDAPWRNYLMRTAFDTLKPAAADGGPHVSFNPWLEGRFPDGGHGGGTVSNCMACHQRASYPPLAFLPVRRGAPDFTHDPAFAPGRLRTSSIWSLALHAKPGP
jgi:hypothetical protein